MCAGGLQERDFLPVLLELARLARPKHAPADDGSGAMVVLEQPCVAAIGLVEPPADAVTAAVRGFKLTDAWFCCVQADAAAACALRTAWPRPL